MQLPSPFIQRITRIFGDRGRKWLHDLPNIVSIARDLWGLDSGTVPQSLSISYVEFTTTASKEQVVLKIGVPNEQLFSEMEALRVYDGRKTVRQIEMDKDLGAMLLQRLHPGTMLWEMGDNREETRVAAEVISALPVAVPPGHGFPRYARWAEKAFLLTRNLWDPSEKMPRDLIDQAETVLAGILRTKQENMVLHGDLHHGNILLDHCSGWIAIDPKGATGPACLEFGSFLHNRLPTDLPAPKRDALLKERVEILSENTPYPSELIAACGFVDCVLSYCYHLQDGGVEADWPERIALARTLGEMGTRGNG